MLVADITGLELQILNITEESEGVVEINCHGGFRMLIELKSQARTLLSNYLLNRDTN